MKEDVTEAQQKFWLDSIKLIARLIIGLIVWLTAVVVIAVIIISSRLYDFSSFEVLLGLVATLAAVGGAWLIYPLKSELKTLRQAIVDRTRAASLTGVEQRNVFHDRVDKHFSSITVDAYRKLGGLTIDKLSRINLFAGINNSGKTTLLEAVYLLTRQNDFDGLVEVIHRRGKISHDQIDPEWFMAQISNEIRVGGVFDHRPGGISVRVREETEADLDKSRYLGSVEIGAEFVDVRQESVTRVFKGRDRETQAGSIRLLCPIVYSSPFFLNEPQRYASFYEESIKSKSLPKIIEFIRKEILPTLNDIRLVDKRQRFLVDDDNFSSSLDLTNYGEGLQRIFFISLLFASAANGVVLIDEFENAIHTELIGRFSGFIHKLAETFNVQVFLTSHSKECIDAFVKKAPNPDDFSCYALVPSDGTISVREFTGGKFQRLLELGDVDLRRAR